jgi:hypothetical protein
MLRSPIVHIISSQTTARLASRTGRALLLRKEKYLFCGTYLSKRLSKSLGTVRPEGLSKLIIVQLIGSRTLQVMAAVA